MSDAILVFDLETIPDAAGLRRLGAFPAELSDEQGVAHHADARRAAGQSDFLPPHLQRVLVVGCLLRTDKGIGIRCLEGLEQPDPWASAGADDSAEAARIQRFFRILDDHEPTLVSWNGRGFDVPVLQHRALFRGVTASTYWDSGHFNTGMKYNNYLSRYHARHLDLMDQLAAMQGRANASLDAVAQLSGLPGKLGMDGGQVWPAYCAGQTDAVAAYCETDVVNTYLVFLRFQRMRGLITDQRLEEEESLVRRTLEGLVDSSSSPLSGAHWKTYLDAWESH